MLNDMTKYFLFKFIDLSVCAQIIFIWGCAYIRISASATLPFFFSFIHCDKCNIHIFYCFIDSGNVRKVKIKRSLGGASS
jgi:hypothetical protein